MPSATTSSSKKSSISPKPRHPPPPNWAPKHDAFVREKARHGEDPESIRILFEVEFPGVNASKAWIGERMKGSKVEMGIDEKGVGMAIVAHWL
ncbi:hypothetical protein A1O7_09757 [Cladophialophora yegresii CBS 114405]|uniref:Uncharacterized protein n=1 Tax=Cladophialophora yegresii CBS 114405 TaxID=1182544 RepID=W9VG28_9EURO|nr:uncharacterized protein A1O7_09757 [Cladophialophora yegresii CBS 114405]EXJ54418.1 hypothetical protein A1O7_09757 [Cladophialophora yegresii CBS 114405]